jgi:hypothetical protein
MGRSGCQRSSLPVLISITLLEKPYMLCIQGFLDTLGRHSAEAHVGLAHWDDGKQTAHVRHEDVQDAWRGSSVGQALQVRSLPHDPDSPKDGRRLMA